ncbi:MAG TPA: hypothetical protein V6D07_12890 [Trichocoleus sp.]
MPSKARAASTSSKAGTFFAALALQFFFWFGIQLLSLQMAEGRRQRPYGCRPHDKVCVTHHQRKVAMRTWAAYLAIAPPLAALAVRHLSRQESSKSR